MSATPQDDKNLPDFGAALSEPSAGQMLRRRVFGHTGLVIGGTILLIIALMALLAPLIAPHDPYAHNLANRLVPPIWHDWFYDDPRATWTHIFGTDHQGRDYLSRIIYGARISLLIGFSAAIISGVIGCTLGLVAGYYGGRVDMVVNFIITTRLAMPVILVALAVVALMGSSLTIVVLVLGFLLWDQFAVVMRTLAMQMREFDFVTSAQALGCSPRYIIMREILPNVLNALLVVMTIEMANAILLEAALSFLGLGVQPPLPSWGLMLSQAKDEIFFDPWMITIPGLALLMLVLAINLIGDGLRDVTSPEGRS